MKLAFITNPAINPSVGDVTVTKPTPILLTYTVNFLQIAMIGGVVIFVFVLIIGSIEYITAGGEKEKAGAASKKITAALTGLVIMFSTFAITALIKYVFGIDILNLNLPVIK